MTTLLKEPTTQEARETEDAATAVLVSPFDRRHIDAEFRESTPSWRRGLAWLTTALLGERPTVVPCVMCGAAADDTAREGNRWVATCASCRRI